MKNPFLIALGLVAVTVAACGGKVVVESSGASGTGGAGGTATTLTTADGAPNPTTNVAVAVAVSAVAATSVTTGTGSSGCDPTYTCAQAIAPADGDPNQLCDGPSGQLYDALAQCVCADACSIQCSANACVGQKPSASCTACLQDTMSGCGNQFNACANDI